MSPPRDLRGSWLEAESPGEVTITWANQVDFHGGTIESDDWPMDRLLAPAWKDFLIAQLAMLHEWEKAETGISGRPWEAHG